MCDSVYNDSQLCVFCAMALTDLKLKRLVNKPSDPVQVKSDRDGMPVRIAKQGRISFQYRYLISGNPARYTIGRVIQNCCYLKLKRTRNSYISGN